MSDQTGEASGNPSKLSLPAPGLTGRFRSLISFDRMLFVCLLALLLFYEVISYLGLHFDSVFIWVFAFSWWFGTAVSDLLPAGVASLVIPNLFMLVVGECLAVILVIRFIKLRTLKSPALWSCAALFVAYYFAEPQGTRYLLDQVRFQINRGSYLAMAKASEGWPDYVVLDWGATGFLTSSSRYFLVLDRTGQLAAGKFDPASFVERSEKTTCEGAVQRLSSEFFSVAVYCEER